MRAQEAALEDAFGKIARIIGQNYGITVVIRGTQAFIDLKTRIITLPSLGSEVVQGLDQILEGLLDHEVGHSLFTDLAAIEKMKPAQQLHQLFNAIEDPRIETSMRAKYIGCGQNLDEANLVLDARVLTEWPKLGLWQRLLMALVLSLRGAPREQFELDDKIGPLFGLIRDELAEAAAARSTSDALTVARKILDKLSTQDDGEAKAGGEEGEGSGEA